MAIPMNKLAKSLRLVAEAQVAGPELNPTSIGRAETVSDGFQFFVCADYNLAEAQVSSFGYKNSIQSHLPLSPLVTDICRHNTGCGTYEVVSCFANRRRKQACFLARFFI